MTVLWYSGTGNTLRAVKQALAEGPVPEEERRILPLESSSPQELTAESRFLIAFPVLAFRAPAQVFRFLRSLGPGAGRSAVLFATWAGNPFGALENLSAWMQRRGWKIERLGGALYPENWTQLTGCPPLLERGPLWQQGDDQARAFGRSWAAGTLMGDEGPSGKGRQAWGAWLAGLAFSALGRRILGLLYTADGACNGCGYCVRTCPAQAIRLVRNRPVWSHSCEACNRCINLCPQATIQTSLLRIGLGLGLSTGIVFAAGYIGGFLPPVAAGILLTAALLLAPLPALLLLNPLQTWLGQGPRTTTAFGASWTRSFPRYREPDFHPPIRGTGESPGS